MEIIILIIAIFFAINMGSPSFAGSFSTAVGSKAIDRRAAGFLFFIFGILGAVLLGSGVANTIGKGIIPSGLVTNEAALIILFSATVSLFTANLMHIPQSTSLSTLASIGGVGYFHHQISWGKIQFLVLAWVIAMIVGYGLIYWTTRYVYPPKRRNFWIYEKLINNRERLKYIVLLTSCYKGFAQGTNNVANVVGPLAAAGILQPKMGLVFMGIMFGLGAFGFTGPMNTSSQKIVPLGLLTATIINVISGTLTIMASKFGIPFPTVIVYTVSIFAIGNIKDGLDSTLKNPVTRKTFFTWVINPIITFGISFLLSSMFLQRI